MSIKKDYFNEFINVTEQAAIGAYPFIGKGDKIAADQGSVDKMRNRLNLIDMIGEGVIGEEEIGWGTYVGYSSKIWKENRSNIHDHLRT